MRPNNTDIEVFELAPAEALSLLRQLPGADTADADVTIGGESETYLLNIPRGESLARLRKFLEVVAAEPMTESGERMTTRFWFREAGEPGLIEAELVVLNP